MEKMFSNFVKVQPIQFSGKENRYQESYNTDVNAIVHNISERIELFLYGKKPIAFFSSGCTAFRMPNQSILRHE